MRPNDSAANCLGDPIAHERGEEAVSRLDAVNGADEELLFYYAELARAGDGVAEGVVYLFVCWLVGWLVFGETEAQERN